MTVPRADPSHKPGRPNLSALPAVLLSLLLVLATAEQGGFQLRDWAPPAVFALMTLAVLYARRSALRPDRRLAIALAAIWCLGALTLLSATWSESPAGAIEAAARTVFYAALVSVPLVTVGQVRVLRFIGLGVILGVSAIAVATLVALNVDGKDLFLAGRLDDPLGYRNATACLFAFTFWPLIVFAAARGGARLARGAEVAAATLALGLAFLTESRGVLFGLALGGAVVVGIGPERVRRVWLAALSVGGVALFSGSLLTPYHAFAGGRGIVTADDVTTAARSLALLTAVAFLIGVLIAILDNGLRPEGVVWARRVGRTALAIATVGALVAAVASVGNPIRYAGDKLDEFRDVNASSTGTTRLSATGGQRYDLWRVAWTGFESRPIAGVGAGSYPLRYYRFRRTDRNVTDPHSLLLDVLSGTGLAGLGLLAGFVAAISATLWAGRSSPRPDRRAASALVAAGAVVFGQAQLDFFWTIPGLAGLGLLCLVLGAALMAPPPRPPDPADGGPRATLAAVALLAATLGLLSLFLSDYEVRRARAERSPAASLAAARRAERLNPWALAPRYLQASALETMGRRAAARAELRGALRMEPRNFVVLGLLGDLEVRAGDLADARRYYARALALNPLDVGLRKLAGIGAGHP